MPVTRKRVSKILNGNAVPKTQQEWAIHYKNLRRVNADRERVLHRNAAIRKGSLSAGKIVVIPPSKESL